MRIIPIAVSTMSGTSATPRRILKSTACAIATVLSIQVGHLQAQQVPIPQTAAEVPGPAPGPMTKAYVQEVGRMAYIWGWPLAYVYNQRTELTKAPETALIAGHACLSVQRIGW